MKKFCESLKKHAMDTINLKNTKQTNSKNYMKTLKINILKMKYIVKLVTKVRENLNTLCLKNSHNFSQ